jgi:hypothetical protein
MLSIRAGAVTFSPDDLERTNEIGDVLCHANRERSGRPSLRDLVQNANPPKAEALGYCRMSLRDDTTDAN